MRRRSPPASMGGGARVYTMRAASSLPLASAQLCGTGRGPKRPGSLGKRIPKTLQQELHTVTPCDAGGVHVRLAIPPRRGPVHSGTAGLGRQQRPPRAGVLWV